MKARVGALWICCACMEDICIKEQHLTGTQHHLYTNPVISILKDNQLRIIIKRKEATARLAHV